MMTRFASSNVLWVIAGIFIALLVGSVLRLIALHWSSPEITKSRKDSLITWWVLAIAMIGAALLGRSVPMLLFTLISSLALWEFSRLSPDRAVIRPLMWMYFALIPINYLWIGLGWDQTFTLFMPSAVLLFSGVFIFANRRSRIAVRSVVHIGFGAFIVVYGLSHAVQIYNLPEDSNPDAGLIGWFLYLLILTEWNDIAQALLGRAIGRKKITPRLSPHKTWEGFLGGVVSTTALAILLAMWLTPFTPIHSAIAGVTMAVIGFLGDLNMSAVKRRAGVKDSGRLLPGHGGVLDRIDSLTLSAPMFYYFVLFSKEIPTVIDRYLS